jgi:serine phosphatase RsbU (regulator of sigma subunit)
MKNFVFICFLASLSLSGYAQSVADSLVLSLDTMGNSNQKVTTLNTISAQYKTSDIAKSEYYALEASKLAEELNDKKGLVAAKINLGNVFLTRGIFSKAIEEYLIALRIAEGMETTTETALIYNNLGSSYYRKGELDKALDYYRKGMGIFNSLRDELNAAKAGLNIGNIELALKNFDNAINITLPAIDVFIKHNYLQGRISAYSNLGVVYNEKQDFHKALSYLNEAYILGQQLKNDYILAAVSVNMGFSYWKLRQFDKAGKLLVYALETSKKIGVVDLQREASKHLSQFYYETGNYKKAYEVHVLFKESFDSLANLSNVRKITELELTYNFEKKQREQELLNKEKEITEKETRKVLIIMLISALGAFLSAIFIAFLIYRSRQNQKKVNERLKDANEEIVLQKEILASANKQLTDSIAYARRIQDAILPPAGYLKNLGMEHFIFYQPRDVVSGDFYWFKKIDNCLFFAVADCTGHGVPGAFMSMLGISLLNEIANKKEPGKPSDILELLRRQIKTSLHQTWENKTHDGMDMALCAIDLENNTLHFAGANINLFIHKNNELAEYKGTRNPIGIYLKESPFANYEIPLQQGDMIYLMTDGFSDQMGGGRNRKFKPGAMRTMLKSIAAYPAKDQYQIVSQTFFDWKTNKDQLDDILVLGLKYQSLRQE